MAAGDYKDRDHDLVSPGLTTTITFPGGAPAENDLILIFSSNRNGSRTISSAPTGFTEIETGISTGWPIGFLYAKVAGASEGNSYATTWSDSDRAFSAGYLIEGSLSLTDIVNSGLEEGATGTTVDILASAFSSSKNGLAIVFSHFYNDSSQEMTYDNGFDTNEVMVAVGQSTAGYSHKSITHPDTDIQTTATWTTENASSENVLVLVEPPAAAAASPIPVIKPILKHIGGLG